ncbi:hypothetical protein Egran_05225, partial [Elaphomyces granulatus]
ARGRAKQRPKGHPSSVQNNTNSGPTPRSRYPADSDNPGP